MKRKTPKVPLQLIRPIKKSMKYHTRRLHCWNRVYEEKEDEVYIRKGITNKLKQNSNIFTIFFTLSRICFHVYISLKMKSYR